MMAVRVPSLAFAHPAPQAAARVRAWATAVRSAAVRAALLAAIGVELAVLAAWLPDTLRYWDGPSGDFGNLYERAAELRLMNMYNPGLTLALYPLTFSGELGAFRVMFALNAACLIWVAFVAQRGLPTTEARAAVALAIVSLPQMHWALRLGHLTPLLAAAALAGFVLMERRPKTAALVLSLLSFKPQYAVAPFAWLLVRRRFVLCGLMLGAAAAMAVAGFLAIGVGAVRDFVLLYADWGANSGDNLLPVQQSWMYSWPGVQASFGFEPHPLLTFDLLLLSAGVVVVAWARTPAALAPVVTACAMLLLTPYAQFYDFGLVVVAMALLVRARAAVWLTATVVVAMYVAAVVTQANTIFPSRDLLGGASTDGVYWLTPVLLASVALLALVGRRALPAEGR
jgi:hypothetical protein